MMDTTLNVKEKKKSLEIEINGVVTTNDGVDADKFADMFIEWLVSKGYTFGGGIGPLDENELPH